jgi:AraC family transcriptional regulator
MVLATMRPRGRLFIAHDLILFLGEHLVTAPHHHFTAAVTLALDGPLSVRESDRTGFRKAQCMIARPNAEHELDASGSMVVNLQIDPETDDYARLVPRGLGKSPLILLERDEVEPLIDRVTKLIASETFAARELRATVLDYLGSESRGDPVYDPRISRVLAVLKQRFPDAPTTAELAEQAALSENRLIRLFGSEVGVPLRRYVLWLRVRHVVFCLAAGQNLTDAAHEAGFADSAHLTRVFRDMFGVAPSQLLRSDDVQIQLVAPDSEIRGPHAEQDLVRLERVFDMLFSEPSGPGQS